MFLLNTIATVGLIVAGSTSAATISLSPSPANVNVGTAFSLDVLATNVIDLYTYQFDVAFNPAKLQANAITEGPFLATSGTTFFIPGMIDNTAGLVSFTADTLIGAISGVTGSGSLATISFQALATGSSQVAVDSTSALFLDSNGNDISPLTFQNGTVNIAAGGGATIPEPSTVLSLAGGLGTIMLAKRRF